VVASRRAQTSAAGYGDRPYRRRPLPTATGSTSYRL